MPFRLSYKNIFNKEESDTNGRDMLLNLVKQYPYFSAAHFFLLKQTASQDPAYNSIAATTALHFNNLFLLQDKLHQSADELSNDSEVIATVFTGEEDSLHDVDTEATEIAQVDPIVTALKTELVETVEEIPVASNDNEGATSEQPLKENDLTVMPQEVGKNGNEIQEEPLLFQPLFASDYFASQGIKLREDTHPTDKLGKQLKSFTDWLKTMKKVHEGKLPNGNESLDSSVQVLAEKSNREEEILTETMAEVYLQQGKGNKAKEIYEKLSLLNPSKNAYFAAKIDQIQ
jgi:hypothetical protein